MEPTLPPPLPTPRQMLTSLINSLSSIPPPEPADQHSPSSSSSSSAAEDDSAHEAANPALLRRPRQKTAAGGGGDLLLGSAGVAYRPLLTTLHALFPTILLAALDLLDRGLVSRLEMETTDDATDAAAGKNVAYHVRSAATARRRRNNNNNNNNKSSSSSSKANVPDPAYAVRLGAWSCSCAAFAFSAFSGDGGGRDPRDSGSGAGAGAGGGGLEDGGGGWEFGGLSIDGREQQLGHGSGGDDDDGGGGLVEVRGVPCCKHLLACLLADRWPVAGRCVAARCVSREELAGIMAGI
ncbi:hypothetical protein RB601_003780 [Gaeumannomyces tritici]